MPHVKTTLARLSDLFAEDWSGAEPEHIMLLGDPGTGKSKLLQHFATKHPRIEHETFTEIPVLYVEVPSKCSIKKLAGVILKSMGSPFWNKGDEVERTFQLVTLLKACKVRLLILDEVNHLVDRGRQKSHYAVADWIKSLSSAGGVPMVLAGIHRARELLDVNEQLADRFREILEIPTLSVAEGHAETTRSTLKAFATLIDGVPTMDLSSEGTARLIVFATGGRLRPLRRLLVRAVEVAFRSKSPCIDMKVLATAFDEVVFKNAPQGRNPFRSGFEAVPLSKPGEPFARGLTC